MRRGYRYTTRDAPIVSGTVEHYRQYVSDRHWRIRLVWKVAAAFRRVSIARYARERLLREIVRDLAAAESGVLDRNGDGLTELFFRRVDALGSAFEAVQRAAASAVDTRRSEFLRFIVSETRPDTYRAVLEAGRYCFDFSEINEHPLGDIRDSIVDNVRTDLLPLRAVTPEPGPKEVWTAIDLVTQIARFPIASLMRTPSLDRQRSEPVRPLLPALIRVEHIRDRCRRTLKSNVFALFDRWIGQSRDGSVSESVRAAVAAMDALHGEELIRYGLSDPLATFRWRSPEFDLYEETVAAFVDVVSAEVAAEALRQAEECVIPYLEVAAPLPEGVPRRTVTAGLNFFRDPTTERTIREIFEAVIDGAFTDSTAAIRLHQVVSSVEDARGVLTRLFHSSETRTAEVEQALRRRAETADKPLLREQKRRMYLIGVTRQVEATVADLSASLIAIHDILREEESHPLYESVSGWKRFGTGLLNLLRVEQRR
ncbi:MAG: hypothetical protein ACOC2V_03325 [Alkalispirochaeta sp.]